MNLIRIKSRSELKENSKYLVYNQYHKCSPTVELYWYMRNKDYYFWRNLDHATDIDFRTQKVFLIPNESTYKDL